MLMKDKDNLIRVYTGTEISVKLLKDELEKIEIVAMIKNDYNSGIIAGFSSGTHSSVDLFIQEIDMDKADPIINGFIELNK